MSRRLFRHLLLSALLAVVPTQAFAQGKGDVEVFFGINYLPFALEGVEAIAGDSTLNMWGIHGDVTFYLGDHFGVMIEGSFPRKDVDLTLPTPAGDVMATVEISQATYMAGPRYRFSTDAAFRPSIQALIGFSSGSLGATQIEGLGVPIFLDLDDSSFAASAAANFDLRLGDSFALRLLQAGVLFTGYGDSSQTSLRLSAGLVGRF